MLETPPYLLAQFRAKHAAEQLRIARGEAHPSEARALVARYRALVKAFPDSAPARGLLELAEARLKERTR
jgi:hypothetical protein